MNDIEIWMQLRESEYEPLKIGDVVFNPHVGFDSVSKVLSAPMSGIFQGRRTQVVQLDIRAEGIMDDATEYRKIPPQLLVTFTKNAKLTVRNQVRELMRFRSYK